MKIQDLSEKEQEYVIKYLKVPDLLPEEERKLLLEIKRNSLEAKKKLASHNQKLVWSVIEDIEPGENYSFAVLWEAGNNGLLNAINSFSFEKKIPFRKYAHDSIKESIAKRITYQNGLPSY